MQNPRPPLQKYHRKNNPSFSSSLLDAITRSLDDSDNLTGGDPTPPPVTRLHYSTPSSSSSSSFFSSDTDTVRIRPIRTGPVLTRSDRIRSDPFPNHPQNQNTSQNHRNRNLTSIKKKLRDLRRSNGQNSPGAKLAGFLNSIFAGNPKKPKIAGDRDRPPPPPSSCSRSCLIKTPSTRGSNGGKRSVRFSDGPARPTVRMAVEEGWESDSSEDLFELENLGGFIANNGSKSFRDELPVYETTSLGMNRAIARGLVV